jgi:hypothetical protein
MSPTMMRAKFGVLRQILLDLGFTMQTNPRSVRFDHEATKTWFLYPPYTESQDVSQGDLVGTRYILDQREFLPREQFEELLRERLIAG